jgi:hypothetical protein
MRCAGWALVLLAAAGPLIVAADGCKDCVDQRAGNCYHASWSGKSDDKCSKEKNGTKCRENDDGVWCLGPVPSLASQCCQHCEHVGHCHNHCNTTTTKAECAACAKHENLQWCAGGGPSPSPSPGPPARRPIALKEVTFYGYPSPGR